MTRIISCDWGTTSLRLRLVDLGQGQVLEESSSNQGIAGIFESWDQSAIGQSGRLIFYTEVLKNALSVLQEKTQTTIAEIPLVISGMASSNIGMQELPYTSLPCPTDGRSLLTAVLEPTHEFNHRILLISGVKTDRDVIRGEETQLVGCATATDEEEGLYVFPGTHSKHVIVRKGLLQNFTTYMTGEFFSLLSAHGLLSRAVQENSRPLKENILRSFRDGVADGASFSLLHSSFFVRTNILFDKQTKEENYHYLSGLLIGAELKEVTGVALRLTVVGDERQLTYYKEALQTLNLPAASFLNAAEAIVHGHCKLFKTINI